MQQGAARIRTYMLLIVVLYAPTALVVYLALTTTYEPIAEYAELRLFVLVLLFPVLFKYLLQICIAPFYGMSERVRKKRIPSHARPPSITVAIPAWNEEVGVMKTIRSVLATQYPHLEVIVINDGSTDGTHDVVSRFIEEYEHEHSPHQATVRYRACENGGKARALNIALAMASSELFVTIDADSVMDGNALHHMARHFTDPRVAAVAGNVVIGNRHRSLGLMQQLEYLYGFYFKRADSLFNAVYIVGGAAAAYRRDVVQRMGGFDTSIITEDIELSTRLQDAGYRVRYAADAIVYTEGPSDLPGLCRQRLRWKYGRLLTFAKHHKLFFSMKREHRFYLSFIVLPIALFSEMLLFFEWLLVGGFYIYTVYTNDYAPLLAVIVLLACIVALQVSTDPLRRYHGNLLILAPGAWLIFYWIDAIEYQALVRSIYRLVTRKELRWQRWNRAGVFGNDHVPLTPHI